MAQNADAQQKQLRPDIIDPLIGAHIHSLCTALGGFSVDGSGKYTLGDDALSVLKDLRRWLKLHDEKLSRFDVARGISEVSLVQGDLLEIIAMWKEDQTMMKPKHRAVLACIELICPLTWPFERNNDQMTNNHHRHIPVLQHAQAKYKTAMLNHHSGKILKNIIRASLSAMAMPSMERGVREEGVIRLILSTLGNIVQIEHPMPTENDTGEDIDRSATINAFAEQSVFDLLLTISSGVLDDFRLQDTTVLEVIYQLIKGLDVESVFRTEKDDNTKLGNDLTSLLRMEDAMKRSHAHGASTRHNRFGTTVWMERNDGTRSFVSGQEALLGEASGLNKMDQSKKHKARKPTDRAGTDLRNDCDMTVALKPNAKKNIRKFVEDFIDSGFNPLFLSIRRAIDRDVDRLLDSHSRQYFYLVAWFLEAERVRRRAAAKERKKAGISAVDGDSFGVVAAVLNQEFLVTLNRRMVDWFDLKKWTELEAGMKCFTQILYTIQDMAVSKNEDDQDIAENIQNRLFYEEASMELVCNICRAYTIQPFRWLDDCTEMAHAHLKLLEKYSQQHEHMFVRARRRQSKKKKQQALEDGETDTMLEENDEEMAEAGQRAVRERAFNFTSFESKYLNPKCINTFIALLGFYKELNASQLMRGIKMLHRIFEKRGAEITLYRLDLVDLLNRMMQGPEALPKTHPAFKEVDRFARHYFRKLFSNLEREPTLYVELLFTKINYTTSFLQHGIDQEKHFPKPRAAAQLVVKPGTEHNHFGIGVGALIDDMKSEEVEWLKDVLRKAISQRKQWEDDAQAQRLREVEDQGVPNSTKTAPLILISPETDERKTALFKDGVLRFLMTLIGCEKSDLNETIDSQWHIPASLTSAQLSESLSQIEKYANDPPVFEDGLYARELLRRKLLPPTNRSKRRDALSSDDASSGDDNEMLFEPGGPTEIHGPKEKKKGASPRKKRPKIDAEEGALEKLREEKRLMNEAAEALKKNKIKSAKWIEDSDDDSEADREFFAAEEIIRNNGPRSILGEPILVGMGRMAAMPSEDEDGDEHMVDAQSPAPPTRKRKKQQPKKAEPKKKSLFGASSGSESDSDVPDRSSSVEAPSTSSRRKNVKTVVVSDDDEEDEEEPEGRNKDVEMADDEDEEDLPVSTKKRRVSRRAVVDSDDE